MVDTKKQSSRKGKRAWRKNIDIGDVETGLEEVRDRQRLLGNDDDADFIIDTTPSSKDVKEKKLKTQEILSNKSKINPLVNTRASGNKTKKVQGVSKTDLLKLVQLNGGKYKSESRAKARVDKDGLTNVKNKDIWGDNEEEDDDEDIPEEMKVSSISEVTTAKVIPSTLKKAPIKISHNDLTKKIVDAGKSYNPSLESWKSLINKEYDTESKRELTRQKLQEHRERIQYIIETINGNDLSDSEDDDNEQEQHEEDKGQSTQEEDFKLSVNKPTETKIKTKAKRNKEAKHKKRVELEQEIKQLKIQIKDLSNLDDILTKQLAEKPKRNKREKHKLFKYDPVVEPLEVKLSDELTNNLKNVKAEGNLFYDTMLNLQSSGKIETRIPVAKRRKYTPKITEKWTYKDFK
jgi:nucleolar protein 53